MGEILAKEILKTKQQESAFVLGLEGDLGGGKTTFLQGFARGLGIKEKILSPTFIIMRKFRMGPKRSLGGWRAGWSPIRQPADQFLNLYHIDCYRIKKTKEILELGFKEVISQPPNIIAIEWADRIRKILPKYILILKFKFIKKNKREIIVQYKND